MHRYKEDEEREFEDNFIIKLFISIEVGLKPFPP